MCTTLETLMLNDNRFEGRFPKFIGNLKKLKRLNLRCNQITELCPQLGALTTLQELQVRGMVDTGDVNW